MSNTVGVLQNGGSAYHSGAAAYLVGSVLLICLISCVVLSRVHMCYTYNRLLLVKGLGHYLLINYFTHDFSVAYTTVVLLSYQLL